MKVNPETGALVGQPFSFESAHVALRDLLAAIPQPQRGLFATAALEVTTVLALAYWHVNRTSVNMGWYESLTVTS